MEEIKSFFKKVKWDSIIIAILTIMIGILCVCLPESSANVLCIIFGCALIAMGLAVMVRYFAFERILGGQLLIMSATLIVAGVFCLANPAIVQSILTIVLGLFIVIDSITSFADSVDCARARVSGWWVLMLLSIATACLGVAVMFAKFSTVMIFAGASLIVEGVVHFVSTLVFSRKVKQAKKILTDKHDDIVL